MSFNATLFIDTIRQLQGGKVQTELSEKLNECVTAAKHHGKVAKIKVELTIQPDGSQVFITEKVDQTLPQKDRPKTLFWPTEDGNLSRKDPSNLELDLKSVQTPNTESTLVQVDS